MRDSTLSKIAIICSISGLLILFAISFFIRPESRSIPSLTQEDDSRTISIFGYVQKSQSGKVTKLRISQLHCIDAIMFENISIPQGAYIKATGEYRHLRGNKELVLDHLDIQTTVPYDTIADKDFS